MNWVQYKDLLSYNCLCGTVVESLSLTQEILGSNPAIFLFDLNFLSLNSVKAFRENSIDIGIEYLSKYLLSKALLFYNCLCGTVVESLSLTQEILGSNPAIFLFHLNFFVTEFSEFSESI